METKIKSVLSRMVFMLMVATVFALAVPRDARAAIINVPADYPTIQAAINVAGSGDTVQVAPGTYYEQIAMKPGVTIQGSGAEVTSIDGGENKYVVSGRDNSTITGFTITGGTYGIYCSHSSPTITNNIVTGNSYHGIYCQYSSNPTITNNIVTGNSYHGIYCQYSSNPTITNNIVTGNSYHGIYCQKSKPTINNNTITDNGRNGISLWLYCHPTITENTITGNGYHGIDCCYSCSPTITNNTITGNKNGILCRMRSSPHEQLHLSVSSQV